VNKYFLNLIFAGIYASEIDEIKGGHKGAIEKEDFAASRLPRRILINGKAIMVIYLLLEK
jgi:hypothetical protein